MFLRFGGGVAQLVERYVRNVEVGGSSPLTSTDRCPSYRSLLSELLAPRRCQGAIDAWSRLISIVLAMRLRPASAVNRDAPCR